MCAWFACSAGAQYVFEEKIMSSAEGDHNMPALVVCIYQSFLLSSLASFSPPHPCTSLTRLRFDILLLRPSVFVTQVVGMEGFWGLLLSLFVCWPVFYIIPGPDKGSMVRFGAFAADPLILSFIQILVVFLAVCVVFVMPFFAYSSYRLCRYQRYRSVLYVSPPSLCSVCALSLFFSVVSPALGKYVGCRRDDPKQHAALLLCVNLLRLGRPLQCICWYAIPFSSVLGPMGEQGMVNTWGKETHTHAHTTTLCVALSSLF